MAKLLKGSEVVAGVSARSREAANALRARGIVPTLALVKVGDRSADAAYERGARKRAAEAGVEVISREFPEDVAREDVLSAILELDADSSVHGILLFRPLPKQLDEAVLCAAIAPGKDVDAATEASLSGVYTGSGAGFAPCTAQAVVEMLLHYGVPLQGAHVCVIGRSQVVGKPCASLLLDKNATVTVCHSRTRNLADITGRADVVVVATGRARAFGVECFASGQTVIDVGINWDEASGRVVGDVDFDAVEPVVEAISPVPGGVGAVTSAVLISHVVAAAERANR